MSRTVGLLLTIVGGLAIAAGVGSGAVSLVADDEPVTPESVSVESGTGGGEPDMFIYGTR